MKKALCLVLALVLCLTMCGCDRRSNVKKQAAEAPVLSLRSYRDLYNENAAKAEAEYDGNVYRVSGYVVEISSTYCVVGKTTTLHEIYIYLAKEDLVKLEKGEWYTFAGVFKSEVLVPNLYHAVLVEE